MMWFQVHRCPVLIWSHGAGDLWHTSQVSASIQAAWLYFSWSLHFLAVVAVWPVPSCLSTLRSIFFESPEAPVLINTQQTCTLWGRGAESFMLKRKGRSAHQIRPLARCNPAGVSWQVHAGPVLVNVPSIFVSVHPLSHASVLASANCLFILHLISVSASTSGKHSAETMPSPPRPPLFSSISSSPSALFILLRSNLTTF